MARPKRKPITRAPGREAADEAAGVAAGEKIMKNRPMNGGRESRFFVNSSLFAREIDAPRPEERHDENDTLPNANCRSIFVEKISKERTSRPLEALLLRTAAH